MTVCTKTYLSLTKYPVIVFVYLEHVWSTIIIKTIEFPLLVSILLNYCHKICSAYFHFSSISHRVFYKLNFFIPLRPILNVSMCCVDDNIFSLTIYKTRYFSYRRILIVDLFSMLVYRRYYAWRREWGETRDPAAIIVTWAHRVCLINWLLLSCTLRSNPIIPGLNQRNNMCTLPVPSFSLIPGRSKWFGTFGLSSRRIRCRVRGPPMPRADSRFVK